MMRENRDLKFVKIEAKGFQDLCNRIKELEAENKKLILENEEYHEMLKSEMDKNQDLNRQLERQVRFKMGLKFSNRILTQQRNELQEELDTIKSMGMFEFGNTYCSSESLEADGHAFARSLGIGGK